MWPDLSDAPVSTSTCPCALSASMPTCTNPACAPCASNSRLIQTKMDMHVPGNATDCLPGVIGPKKGPWWETISVHWNNTQENYSLNLTTGLRASSQSHCSQNVRVAIKCLRTCPDRSWITMRSRTQSQWLSLKQWGRGGSLHVTPPFVFDIQSEPTTLLAECKGQCFCQCATASSGIKWYLILFSEIGMHYFIYLPRHYCVIQIVSYM